MTKLSIDDIDFEKSQGLVPIIVQDSKSKDILMLAYANRLAIEETIRTCLLYTSPSPRDS